MTTYPAELGVVPYERLRPDLDVFVVTWVGASLLSRAIRRFAPGGSHTSLGLNLYGSIMLIEAMELGVEPNRASDRFDDYDGDIFVHPIRVAADVADGIKATALKMCGSHVRYGYRTLFALSWRRVRNVMRRPVCSQTTGYILAKHGVIPPQDHVISPGGLRTLLPAPWRLAPYSKEAD